MLRLNQRKIHFTPNKENNILNIVQIKSVSGDTKRKKHKIKVCVNLELRSAHGRTVNNTQLRIRLEILKQCSSNLAPALVL